MSLHRQSVIYIAPCMVFLCLCMISPVVMGQHNAQLGPKRGRAPPKWDSLLWLAETSSQQPPGQHSSGPMGCRGRRSLNPSWAGPTEASSSYITSWTRVGQLDARRSPRGGARGGIFLASCTFSFENSLALWPELSLRFLLQGQQELLLTFIINFTTFYLYFLIARVGFHSFYRMFLTTRHV